MNKKRVVEFFIILGTIAVLIIALAPSPLAEPDVEPKAIPTAAEPTLEPPSAYFTPEPVVAMKQDPAPEAERSTDESLLLYLPLDGSAQDYALAPHDTSPNKVAPAVDRNGREGGACSFSYGSWIEVSGAQEFNHLEEFTMTAWIYPTTLREHLNIISKVTPHRDFNLQVSAEGRVLTHIMFGEYEFCYSDSSIEANQWTFVAATYSNHEWKVYLNGKLDGQITVKNDPPWVSEFLTVGNLYPGSGEAFLGSLDEVRLYNRALASKEIKSLMN